MVGTGNLQPAPAESGSPRACLYGEVGLFGHELLFNDRQNLE